MRGLLTGNGVDLCQPDVSISSAASPFEADRNLLGLDTIIDCYPTLAEALKP
ncbi:hypothetical protein OHB33_01305 [Streptomyces sp. NBC_01558]|uniref:hypothetical protein n=1 Tax=Streptomyces sp. NBC_01558 TaxID=2975878 RepID=UPI002DD93524|nr:hypothetical protein [Streptomyces sp. NBC_01558]WSD75038.1 hypothetical protein OHB33_01305 [Streptomyces sp. NBC_01558]